VKLSKIVISKINPPIMLQKTSPSDTPSPQILRFNCQKMFFSTPLEQRIVVRNLFRNNFFFLPNQRIYFTQYETNLQ
jgi:hypothetical protein